MSSSLALSRHWYESEPSSYHDPSLPGFVSLDLMQAGRYKAKPTRLQDLPEALENLRPGADAYYLSQGQFFKRSRAAVHLWRMPVVFSDLDTYSIPELRDMDPERLCGWVLISLEDLGLPLPSIVLSSGRGLHLKWVLSTPLPRCALLRWQAVQRELSQQLRQFGADPRAVDASRVLRLEGTMNRKSGTVVRVLYRAQTVAGGNMRLSNGCLGWDFEDLAERLLPLSRDEIHRRSLIRGEAQNVGRGMPAANDDVSDTRPVDDEANASRQKLFGGRRSSAANLNWMRLNDLRRLVELRGWAADGVPDGQRDTFMFLAACFLCHSAYLPNLKQEVLTLGREFVPDWTEAKLISKAHAALQRASKADTGKRLAKSP